jgi:hypothetical protein
MEKKAPSQEIDPLYLPLGTQVGPWRVTDEVAHRARALEARPLFVWGYDQTPCVRSPEAVQLSAQRDTASRQTLEQREAEKTRAATSLEQRRHSAFAPAWAAAGVAAILVLVLVLVTVRRPVGESQAGARMGSRENRSVSVGDGAMSPAFALSAPDPQGESAPKLARPLQKPLPGQRLPPCTPRIETVLQGACWVCVDNMKPPCGTNAYEWEGRCCIPSFNAPRQPTSNPPE